MHLHTVTDNPPAKIRKRCSRRSGHLNRSNLRIHCSYIATSYLLETDSDTSSRGKQERFSVDKAKWEVFTHPEGNLYFRKACKGKKGTRFRFLTEDFLFNPISDEGANAKFRRKFEQLTRAVSTLRYKYENGFCKDPNDYAIDIYIGESEKGGFDYYFINHTDRSIFWKKAVDMKDHCDISIQSRRHLGMLPSPVCNCCDYLLYERIGILLEYLYWLHVRQFPLDEAVQDKAIYRELCTVLLYGCCG